jgi:hypothetical protein
VSVGGRCCKSWQQVRCCVVVKKTLRHTEGDSIRGCGFAGGGNEKRMSIDEQKRCWRGTELELQDAKLQYFQECIETGVTGSELTNVKEKGGQCTLSN